MRSCRLLAVAAQRLERVNARSRQEFAEILSGDDFPRTRQVAANLFSKIVIEQAGSAKQVALSLRIVGILICVSLNRPEKCPCWKALVKGAGIDSAKEQLNQGLPEVLAA